MVGIFADEHMRDERLGRQPALDDAWRCRSLDRRRLAGATAIARAARYQHAERGRHDIEPLGHVFTDDVQGAVAACANLAIDIDNLLDPLEVGGKPTPVDVARLGRDRLFPRIEPGLYAAKRGGNLLERQLQLVGIKLLGARAEAMPLECGDDVVQPLDLSPCVGIRAFEISDAPVTFGDLRVGGNQHGAQQRGIIGKVRLDQHHCSESAAMPPVNRRSAERSGAGRHEPAASPIPPEEQPLVRRSAL